MNGPELSMDVQVMTRHVEVKTILKLKDAPKVEAAAALATVGDRRYIPQVLSITYGGAWGPTWRLRVKADVREGMVAMVRDLTAQELPEAPQWITDLVKEHEPPTLDI